VRDVSTIERAFQLARAGACHSVTDIRQRLASEGYDNVHGHTSGTTVQRQLRELLAARGVSIQSTNDDDFQG
jgi:hypothetical protein